MLPDKDWYPAISKAQLPDSCLETAVFSPGCSPLPPRKKNPPGISHHQEENPKSLTWLTRSCMIWPLTTPIPSHRAKLASVSF